MDKKQKNTQKTFSLRCGVCRRENYYYQVDRAKIKTLNLKLKKYCRKCLTRSQHLQKRL